MTKLASGYLLRSKPNKGLVLITLSLRCSRRTAARGVGRSPENPDEMEITCCGRSCQRKRQLAVWPRVLDTVRFFGGNLTLAYRSEIDPYHGLSERPLPPWLTRSTFFFHHDGTKVQGTLAHASTSARALFQWIPHQFGLLSPWYNRAPSHSGIQFTTSP